VRGIPRHWRQILHRPVSCPILEKDPLLKSTSVRKLGKLSYFRDEFLLLIRFSRLEVWTNFFWTGDDLKMCGWASRF
jgi:hypothetical protein